MAPNPPPVRVKPALRGVSHELAAYVAFPSALLLAARAPAGDATLAATVYGGSLFFLFAASAFYHRPFWSPRARDIVGRVDHSAIFLLIAGTYTPMSLLLGPGIGHTLLAVVWAGAAGGIALALAWTSAPKPLMAGIYVLLGWTVFPALPALRAAAGDRTLSLLLLGGLFYTVGAGVYAFRRPDPVPHVFGYHEIFHVLVVAAAACHFAMVAAVLRALG
jgi:hemolysin III